MSRCIWAYTAEKFIELVRPPDVPAHVPIQLLGVRRDPFAGHIVEIAVDDPFAEYQVPEGGHAPITHRTL